MTVRISGSYSQEMMGEGDYWEEVTPERDFDVPEVLSVHEFPSEDVKMIPSSPTTTKSPFP